MAHLSMVSGIPSSRTDQVVRRPGEDSPRESRPAHRGEDIAEISAGAREASRAENPGIRAELVRQVRRQIEAGTYVTQEKIDTAADRVSRDLDLLA